MKPLMNVEGVKLENKAMPDEILAFFIKMKRGA